MSLQYILLIKVLGLAIGSIIIYWAFSLFKHGVTAPAGEFNTRAGKYSLFLKKAAPGTFFLLFGSAIILYSIYPKSYAVEVTTSSTKDKTVQSSKITAMAGAISNDSTKNLFIDNTSTRESHFNDSIKILHNLLALKKVESVIIYKIDTVQKEQKLLEQQNQIALLDSSLSSSNNKIAALQDRLNLALANSERLESQIGELSSASKTSNSIPRLQKRIINDSLLIINLKSQLQKKKHRHKTY